MMEALGERYVLVVSVLSYRFYFLGGFFQPFGLANISAKSSMNLRLVVYLKGSCRPDLPQNQLLLKETLYVIFS